LNIDFKTSTFLSQIKKLGRNKLLLVYCQGGKRSALASALLCENGFLQVNDMQGGFDSWVAAGYPRE
jgi:thioredoxin 1